MFNSYNEDCKDTMMLLPNDHIDLVVTSPPYYNTKDYSQYKSVNDYMKQMEEIFTLVYYERNRR